MEKNVLKIVLGATFASLSVAINLMFHFLIPSNGTFGLPYYAIPLVIGGILLGPVYGLLISVVADTAFGLVIGYMPLYTISSLMWGILPGILYKKEYKFYQLAVLIIVSYLLATTANTFANFIYFGSKTALATLPIRLVSLLFNSILIVFITDSIVKRIESLLPINHKKTYETQ